MSGNSLFSFARAFNLLFGAKTEQPYDGAPYDSAESLGYANIKLGRGICPQCDRVSSIGCVEKHEDGGQTHMCGKCGANYRFDADGELLKFAGFHEPIHNKYRQDIAREVESIRWQAAVELDHQSRRAA